MSLKYLIAFVNFEPLDFFPLEKEHMCSKTDSIKIYKERTE